MQGGGVCIRKISGFVKVTSRSSPTKVRSQIFYVRTSQRFERPNRGSQLPPCPGVLSASALRAGALALAPTFTGLRAGRGAGLAWRPVVPRPAPGALPGVPWPRFSWIYSTKSTCQRRKAPRANTEQQCSRSKGSRYEILIAHNAAHRRREGEGQGGPAAAGPGHHVALAH